MVEKQEELNERPADDHLKSAKSAEESHVFAITTPTILFQALMMLTSIYYAMLCTNWGSLN
jgi:hypothetical protein